jgi:hypothetical protein
MASQKKRIGQQPDTVKQATIPNPVSPPAR